MTKEEIRKTAVAMQKLLFFNQDLKKRCHTIVLYLHPGESDPDQEKEIAHAQHFLPDCKILPLSKRHMILHYTKGLDGFVEAMEVVDAFIADRIKEGNYYDGLLRVNLLISLLGDIYKMTDEYRGDAIKNLLRLEDRVMAPTIDLSSFIEWTEEYKGRIPDMRNWSTTKKATYSLLHFLTKVSNDFGCDNLIHLRDKVKSMILTDDAPEVKRMQLELGDDFTADAFKALLDTDGYYRAVQLSRFYLILQYLAASGQLDSISYMLCKEDSLYTLPSEWVEKFMDDLQDEFIPEEENP